MNTTIFNTGYVPTIIDINIIITIFVISFHRRSIGTPAMLLYIVAVRDILRKLKTTTAEANKNHGIHWIVMLATMVIYPPHNNLELFTQPTSIIVSL